MEPTSRFLRGLTVAGTALIACSSASSPVEIAGSAQESIVGGTKGSAYPEAALVDMYQFGQLGAYCSGAVIAPKVVLTAGHCVTGETAFVPDAWVVSVPYNGGQSSKATSALTYDWVATMGDVDPTLHDVGLIFLETPIRISASQCPVISAVELADNSKVVNIGRIQDGSVSTTDLFVSSPVTVMDGAAAGYDFDYSAQDIIESGDSGGPDEVPGSSPHLIVAVNSGGGAGEVLARTDPSVVYKWIQQQVASHGGGCGGSDAGAADAGPKDASATSDASGGSSAPDAASTDAGSSDARARDASTDAAQPATGIGDASPRGGMTSGNRYADGSTARGVDAGAGREDGGNADAENAEFPPGTSSAGCSCRTARSPSTASGAVGSATALALMWSTRRRRGTRGRNSSRTRLSPTRA